MEDIIFFHLSTVSIRFGIRISLILLFAKYRCILLDRTRLKSPTYHEYSGIIRTLISNLINCFGEYILPSNPNVFDLIFLSFILAWISMIYIIRSISAIDSELLWLSMFILYQMFRNRVIIIYATTPNYVSKDSLHSIFSHRIRCFFDRIIFANFEVRVRFGCIEIFVRSRVFVLHDIHSVSNSSL